MTIVYAGDLNPTQTCFRRFEAMRSLGHSVHAVQIFPSERRPQLSKIRHRLSFGPGLRGLNRTLLDAAHRLNPDVVWIDKGIYLWPETVQQLKSRARAVVHYNPDDPFGKIRFGWRLFRAAIPIYDVHFVPRPQNIAEYLALGAQHVFEFDRGYSPSLHRPVELTETERSRFGATVGFVGSYAPAREASIASLVKAGINLSVIGDDWADKPNWPTIRGAFREKGVYAAHYAKALCGLDIALHFVRHENRDQQDSRTFEIPACGVFMLAERTVKHLELFEEGREAAFFSSDDELLAKVKYYLAHPAERQAIAAAGRERCVRSGYDHGSRLANMLKTVTNYMRPVPLHSEPA